MLPDEPNDEEAKEKLAEDGQTPFRPADPSRDPDADADDDRQPGKDLDDTHPSTDSNIEKEELYEGGIAISAGAEEPNKGNSVIGYNPRKAGPQSDDIDERGQ